MRENRSPHGTSAPRTNGSAERLQTTSTPVLAGPREHRGWHRLAASLGALLTVGFLAGGVAPAGAASPLNLITTGSSDTSVGRQIYANLNLMNASVEPTGTATFRLYSPQDTWCSWPIFSSTVAVSDTSVNSTPFVTSVAGTYRWTTSYSGNSSYYGGTTPCGAHSSDVIVGKTRNMLRITSVTMDDGTLSATARLTGYEPGGTITFYLAGPANTWCSGTPVFTSTVAVDGSGDYVSAGYSPPVSGNYSWRATYSGDANNRGASITACGNYNAWVTV